MAPRIIYRPSPAWTDPITDDDDRASTGRFRNASGPTPLHSTEAMLRQEAEMIGADEVIVELALPPAAFRSDEAGVKGNTRAPEFPGVVVRLIGTRFGDLRYACDQFTCRWAGEMAGWEANLRAIALGLEALRKVERYGIARRGEQYAGWAALPPGTPMGAAGRPAPAMTVDFAAAVLAGATDGAFSPADVLGDPDDARACYRLAAKRYHPDKGGSTETFQKVEEAWRLVAAHADR